MSSLIATFAKITPTFYTKFSKIFIAYIRKLFCNSIYYLKTSDNCHDINNWLCG